jgi:tyrosyl-tRNA synthetase
MTMPLLVGTDGKEKMSKSKGNYIGIAEPPETQFGKVMSIPDDVLPDYWRLCLEQEPPELEPMASKLALARGVVELYHGADAAARAEAEFTRVVRQDAVPAEVPEAPLPGVDPIHLPRLLVDAFGVPSTSEARRLILQGGVRLNGDPVRELDVPREALAGAVVQAGKRRFMRFLGP